MLDSKKLIAERMTETGWFTEDGVYVLFDGQFGSTGKGLLASLFAEVAGHNINMVATNAGPNSGHTGYYNGEKIMTQQLPVASIVMDRMGLPVVSYLNGGAVIEPSILQREIDMLHDPERNEVWIHPHAAVIKPEHQGDQLSHIASTGKGVGPAMAAKLGRRNEAVIEGNLDVVPEKAWVGRLDTSAIVNSRCFVETAQGWSLGINSGFYPYVTSRECSVAQAVADLGVPVSSLRKSIVCLRTYPIRVGNTEDGFSGPVYHDQTETTFEALGQQPELTTVTQRVRRVFTWSDAQFMAMMEANRPDAVFLNFCNYLSQQDACNLATRIRDMAREVTGKELDFVLMGWGPYNDDVTLFGA